MTKKILNAMQVAALIKAVGHEITILVEGPAGSGKTSLHKTLSEDPHFAGYFCPTPIDCTQLAEGSVGLPDLDRSRGVSRELPNERFGVSEENHAGVEGATPVLLCLDEIGKPRQFIKDMLAPIVYERRMGNKKFPLGSVIFGCTNMTDEALGDNMQAHIRNRIDIVQMRNPTKDEWIANYALPNNVHPEVMAAAEMYPQVFDCFTDYRPGGKFAGKTQAVDNPFIADPSAADQDQVVTPRSLKTASNILHARAGLDDYTLQAALDGAVGQPFAAHLMAMVRFGEQLPSPARVFADPGGTPLTANPTAQIVQVLQLMSQAKDRDQTEAACIYVSRMRAEMKSLFVNKISNTSSMMLRFATSATFSQMLVDNRKFL